MKRLIEIIGLTAVSEPTGGKMKRMLLVLLEGLTLGTLSQEVYRPVTGYIAFLTVTRFIGDPAPAARATR